MSKLHYAHASSLVRHSVDSTRKKIFSSVICFGLYTYQTFIFCPEITIRVDPLQETPKSSKSRKIQGDFASINCHLFRCVRVSGKHLLLELRLTHTSTPTSVDSKKNFELSSVSDSTRIMYTSFAQKNAMRVTPSHAIPNSSES